MQEQERIQKMASRYIQVLLWPVLIAAIFEIAATHQPNQEMLLFIANSALVTVVVLHAHHEKSTWQTTTTIGAITGGTATLILATYLLITDFHVARLFNLVTQPVFTGLLDAIASGFLASMLHYSQRKRISKKTNNTTV